MPHVRYIHGRRFPCCGHPRRLTAPTSRSCRRRKITDGATNRQRDTDRTTQSSCHATRRSGVHHGLFQGRKKLGRMVVSSPSQSRDLRPYERQASRANIVAVTPMDAGRTLLESAMPTYDVVIAAHLVVAADPPTTFTAARELDLLTVRTPLLTVSMWLRGLPARWSGRVSSTSTPPGDWRRHGLAGVGITWPAAKPRDRLRRRGKVLAAHHRMARCIGGGFQRLRRIWLGQDRREPFRLAVRRVRLAADLRMPHGDYRSRFASAVSALLVDDPAIRRPHPAGDAATDQGQRRSVLDA